MPTNRPKPKWGHRSKALFEDYGKQHYDELQVHRLAEMLVDNVDHLRLDDLEAALNNAANQYFHTRSRFEDGPTHAESKAALRYLQKHAQSLLEGLNMLDDKSWNIVLAPEIAASHKLMSEGKVMTSLGYEIEGERSADGSISYELLEPDDFVGAAQFIECYLSHALEN